MKLAGSFFVSKECGRLSACAEKVGIGSLMQGTHLMEKHIKLVAILNIVYRGFITIGSIVLFILAAVFGRIMEFLERRGELHPSDFPSEILDIIPVIFVVIGIVMLLISLVAVIGSIGVLKRQEWGRITLLVVSFFNLIHVPLGTVLGVYSLWVLLNDEIIRIFNPVPVIENPKPSP
jgi:hypothetical protein